MLPSERLRVGLFVLAVSSIYLMTAWFAVKLILEKLGRRPAPRGPAVWARRGVFAAAGLGGLCIGYGFLIEPYWLEVRRVTIASPKLAPGSPPIRIVHISDLHCDPEPRLEEILPERIAAERPRLIVFTGDALNSLAGLPVFQLCMSRIARVAPTFAVRGNWDTLMWGGEDIFDGTGVRELAGESVRLDLDGTALRIAGTAASKDRMEDALAGARSSELVIYLHHYPDEIYEAARSGVDLYCAGHTHGGQVALPFYGALITLSRFGKRFESGLYRVEGTWLYVNRGIGMEGGRAPRVRFFARPEVTVIDIVPAEGSAPPSRR